jgi:hypothetical protein
MSLKEINKMVKRKDLLSEEEKKDLRYAILTNEKARQTAIRGAIRMNNFSLAMQLSLMNCA